MRELTSGGQQQRGFSYSGQVPRSRSKRPVARVGSGAYLQVAPGCRTTTRACAHRSLRRNARVVRRLAASVAGELVGESRLHRAGRRSRRESGVNGYGGRSNRELKNKIRLNLRTDGIYG